MLDYVYCCTSLYAGCGELPHPSNGNVMETGLTEGSNAVYTCDSDYQLVGERIRTCMSNGMWSGEEPTCLRMKNAFVMCNTLIQVKQEPLI